MGRIITLKIEGMWDGERKETRECVDIKKG